MKKLILRNVQEHNLDGFSVEIPHHSLTVVTGVSGSGKSSLAFDTIFREGQRRFLGTFSAKARVQMGKLSRPHVDDVEGLHPTLALSQQSPVPSNRSTVGTLSEIYDYLRLLFARLGKGEGAPFQASLFSFNSPLGACPACNGLGLVDEVSEELLIADETKSIREGALVPTTSSGYIVYSQVTMDVLDEVCRAHGFNVDIPWQKLSPEQQKIIFYGSTKITVPFGKHPLESRLKWKGITARPREEGYYKGLIPVISDILQRNRTDNILRFAQTVKCKDCAGSRLSPKARSVFVEGHSIDSRAALSLVQLKEWLIELPSNEISDTIRQSINERVDLLEKLGLEHLTLCRSAKTLSSGERNRLRLATQVASGLNGVLYVLDEPTVGLHTRDTKRLLHLLRQLIRKGNTVIVVEHERALIEAADWIIDIGPKAGTEGGQLLFSGPLADFVGPMGPATSPTRSFLLKKETNYFAPKEKRETENFSIIGATGRNLKTIDVKFELGSLNVVTGVPGAGKTTLIEDTLSKALHRLKHHAKLRPLPFKEVTNVEKIKKVITVDQRPIGRTPRSNAATYTKLFDVIRTNFAKTDEAKKLGLTKTHFSFNARGGRCSACEGTGYYKIPMHFLADGIAPCPSCQGKRFNEKTLSVKWRGKNINEVLEMTVDECREHFVKEKKALAYLDPLSELGLGYLSLGQPSTTISGGEAQRIKLATELAKQGNKHTLYLLDEPTTGLHHEDIQILLKALQKLVKNGNTVVVVEHELSVIAEADWIIDLGPESGEKGGEVIYYGPPQGLLPTQSPTSLALRDHLTENKVSVSAEEELILGPKEIKLQQVTTNNLQAIDVSFPISALTVITGPSGSGKSSLAFDTLFAEGQRRFTESLSTYARRFMKSVPKASVEACTGLGPTVAINQRGLPNSPRSTVSTTTGLSEYIRLLYTRFGEGFSGATLSHLSFNDHLGACSRCHGLGVLTSCSPDLLVTHPDNSLLAGAMDGSKAGKFYGETDGQYVATLREVGKCKNIDFSVPWTELGNKARQIAMYGTGEEEYEVTWFYKRGKREGKHELKTVWRGLANLVTDEYELRHERKRGKAMLTLMSTTECPECQGSRLNPKSSSMSWQGVSLGELYKMDVSAALAFFKKEKESLSEAAQRILEELILRLELLQKLGLGYLKLGRGASTLSGGEGRRVQLTSQLSGKLSGVTCVVDEPTIGLHHRDVLRLLEVLKAIRDRGNTVVVVEHDETLWRAADQMIELGPAGGAAGGCLVKETDSFTNRYLAGEMQVVDHRGRKSQTYITIKGARANNLKAQSISIPMEALVAITGVSGSGKTSLIFDVLAASAKHNSPIECDKIEGLSAFKNVRLVDQSPVATTPTSTPATYLGIFDEIRNLFAKTTMSKTRKFNKGRFAYLGKSGQCPHCKGLGQERVSLDFLADFSIQCPQCKGRRYNEETLEILYEGLNIAQALALTASEAREFFVKNSKITSTLELLDKVGLSYLPLGQPLTTLSGGEVQRLKLLNGLQGESPTCYLFDEPTSGLHPIDIKALIVLFQQLVDEGNTVITVEHNLDLIASADWIVDLGPEGGDKGGKVLYCGELSSFKSNQKSHTARSLLQSTNR